MYNDERLFDEIATLEDEKTMLKEAVDDLMVENERLRKENRELRDKSSDEGR